MLIRITNKSTLQDRDIYNLVIKLYVFLIYKLYTCLALMFFRLFRLLQRRTLSIAVINVKRKKDKLY